MKCKEMNFFCLFALFIIQDKLLMRYLKNCFFHMNCVYIFLFIIIIKINIIIISIIVLPYARLLLHCINLFIIYNLNERY